MFFFFVLILKAEFRQLDGYKYEALRAKIKSTCQIKGIELRNV